MKSAALALALLTSVVQTVGWAECCCILICKHQNDPCEHDCKDQQATPAPKADCCSDEPETKTPERCAHVEPSSEVIAQAGAPAPVPPTIVIDLPLVPLAPLSADNKTDRLFCSLRGSPPLHLVNSVLLI